MNDQTTITINCSKDDKRRWMQAHKQAGQNFNDWVVSRLNAASLNEQAGKPSPLSPQGSPQQPTKLR
jgi:hypothetical protein